MKRQTEILIAGSSLIIATLISLGMYHILAIPRNAARDSADQLNPLVREVAIASKEIHIGEPIAGAVVFEKWPANTLRNDFLQRADIEGEKMKALIARRTIAKGEPITNIAVIDRKGGSALAALLQPGMRAASISVDPTSISSGLISPGDIVDVVVVPTGSQTSQTILCAVRVLALDQHTDRIETTKSGAATVPRTATLEVTPQQVGTLASLSKSGVVSLSLHAIGDSGDDKCTVSQQKKPPQQIKIIRG